MAKKETVSQFSYTVCAGNSKFKTLNAQEVHEFNTCNNIPMYNNDSRTSQTSMEKRYNYGKENWTSELKIMDEHHNKSAEMCFNTYKYYRRPIIPFLVPKAQDVDILPRFNYDTLNNVLTNAQKQCYVFSPKLELYRSVGIQTDYRDSETQTAPWEPPYVIKQGHNPEALSIAHLNWNHGLPAGVHEIEIINRIRMRKAWEAVLPPMDTETNIKMRTAIIAALEVDEWAFREQEIQAVMDYRMELMDEMTKTRESEKQRKIQDRFDRLKDFLSKRRDKEVNTIKHNLRRELRKLHKKQKQKQQPAKVDIIKEHANPSSDLYAPQIRFGEHPKRRHEVIRKELLRESYFENVNKIDTLPSWLPTYEDLKAIRPKPKPADLCIRETRWTEEKLKQLHYDLKAIRLKTEPVQASTLLKRKYKPPSLPSTPYKMNIENVENTHMDQLSTFIQKIIRGRAIQCMMFEGRNRCRELIEELQSSHGLEEQGKKQRQKEKAHMVDLQRLQTEKSMQEDRLCEILNSLEGMTISGMLDFLSKELIRLEDERRIHAFALLAERERAMREAAEAGRRQLEYNRRREFDEMFRQIVKVHQDSVEIYLEDIIQEGIEWVSNEAAKEYILELCDKVDGVSKHIQENAGRLAEEELVANMIYNFVLPEVEKNTMRKNIKEKQQNYLRHAHSLIYEQIMNLPPVENINLCDEICDKENAIETLDTGMCSIMEVELKSADTTALKIVESILESIIANVVPV